ncbi:MAG: Uma2 family endonuclease [Bacteroidia bacterium]|nr:Uma2 family endonuclease [Bacteroidia bacterium]
MISENQIIVKGKALQSLSEDEFFNFCQENRTLRIERNAEGEIIIMSPTGSETGRMEMEISGQLWNWNNIHQLGETFGPATGFLLPDSSVSSPDAAWVNADAWNALPASSKNKFAPLCPDFMIEIKSASDHLPTLEAKMQKWIQNGAQLAWLIDPELQQTWIYRANGEVELVEGFDQKISGETVLPGFELDLSRLK